MDPWNSSATAEEKTMPSKRFEEEMRRIDEFRELLTRNVERDRERAVARGEDPGPEGWWKTPEGRANRLRELLERHGSGEQPASG